MGMMKGFLSHADYPTLRSSSVTMVTKFHMEKSPQCWLVSFQLSADLQICGSNESEYNINCSVLKGAEITQTLQALIECVWDISFDRIRSVRHVFSGQVRCMLMAVSKSGSGSAAGLVIVFMWLLSGSTGMPGLRAKQDPVTCEQSSFLTTSICPVLPGPHCVAVESTLPMRPLS